MPEETDAGTRREAEDATGEFQSMTYLVGGVPMTMQQLQERRAQQEQAIRATVEFHANEDAIRDAVISAREAAEAAEVQRAANDLHGDDCAPWNESDLEDGVIYDESDVRAAVQSATPQVRSLLLGQTSDDTDAF